MSSTHAASSGDVYAKPADADRRSDEPAHHASILGLCLAILTGLLVGLAVLLGRCGVIPPDTMLPRFRAASVPDPGP